jgi:hypothetical protein
MPAPTMPARAKQGAEPRIRAGRSYRPDRGRGDGAGNGVQEAEAQINTGLMLFARLGRSLQRPGRSETLPMRKLPTGEPYAGKPPVRFGGRGG